MTKNILINKSFKEVKEIASNKGSYQGVYQVINSEDDLCVELNIDECGVYLIRLYKVDECNWISDDQFESDEIYLNSFETLESLFVYMESKL